MKENALISIIVPVYNREKYLENCIESIINQTYSNLEIILVNDGSTDRSLDICRKYEKEDQRIIVIDQKNSGPSAARNAGLEIAKGKYIGFVDSDDEIDCKMYEVLLNNIVETNAEVSVIGMQFIYKDGEKRPYVKGQVKQIYKDMEIQRAFWNNLTITFAPVDKLILKECIADKRFDTSIKMCEDQKFVYEVLKDVKKVIYDPSIYYNINCSDNSLSRAKPTRYHLAMLDVTEGIIQELDDIEIRESAMIYNIDMCFRYFVVHYNNGEFLPEDIKRVNDIIYNNLELIRRKGSIATKIKLVLFLISPAVLRFVLNLKNR